MSDTTQILVSLIASVPATIGACAALIAARRVGGKGGLHKRLAIVERRQKETQKLATQHIRNHLIHEKVGSHYG